MKAISLWQPWASLVVTGAKRYETRSWKTKYRGPLLIHATQKLPHVAWVIPGSVLEEMIEALQGQLIEQLPRGALLGRVELTGCIGIGAAFIKASENMRDLRFGDFRPGRYAWRLEHVQAFDRPIPYSGRRGLYDVPDDVVQQARPT